MRKEKMVVCTACGVFAVVMLIILCYGCGHKQGGNEKLKASIASAWVDEAWNKGNLNALDELFSSEYVYHNIPFSDMNGLDAYKQFITANRTGYPDIKITMEDIVVEGEKVVSRGTYEGTQQGVSPTMGITTGRQVNFKWCTVSRMENGKFVETWAYVDYLGLRRQIGYTMLPPVTDKTFARLTITQSKPEKYEEQVKIYKESLVPEAKKQKGFRGIMALRDFKTGKAVTISIWDSEADALANEQAGYYKAQVDKFKDFFTTKPVREGYMVTVQE